MKKLMRTEVTVLALVLIAGLLFCLFGGRGNEVPTQAQVPETAAPETAAPLQTEPETTEPKPTWPVYPAGRAMKAKQYFVYDCDENKFLKQSADPAERVYPASITKLFTAYAAMQHLEPETEITAGDALDRVVWGSSVADIQKGDTLTADLLVEAMLLPSGNDAAYLLATEAGKRIGGSSYEAMLLPTEAGKRIGGSSDEAMLLPTEVGKRIGGSSDTDTAIRDFMTEMNNKARQLGMTHTNFVNPDGIHDENHYTSFQDLVILGKMALQNPTVLKNAGTARDSVTLRSGTKDWHNTNALVDPETEYYCPYAIGLKTGQTPSAGSCLLSAFRMDGRTLLIGVFGCPEEEDRFADTLQLFNEAMGIS